jgi:DNA-binding protein H-NS
MARPKSLTAMSVDALLKMRDSITAALSQKAGVLKKELSRMGADYAEVGRIAIYGKKSRLAGRKVAPKYRGPGGVTWAGRGAQPVWLRDAIKAGKKAEDFLIAKSPIPTARKKRMAAKKRKAKKRAA